MLQRRTTLSEISKILGVSISTVSKSLSNSPEIGVETKKKVNAFAKKINYRPNHLAANFRTGSTRTIGLIIPNITNLFYAKVFGSVERYLAQRGYKLITAISNESKLKESKCLNEMAHGYIDGLIICVSKETELKRQYNHINQIINQGIPVVMFDRICESIVCDKVIIDDYQVAYDTTKRLINIRNCKNILMVSLIGDLQHGRLRTKGFKDAVETRGTSIKNKIINATTIEKFKSKLCIALREDKTIDAIFGANEQATSQAIYAIRNVKEDVFENNIVIAGFCSELHKNYDSSLILVDQNAEEIGKQTGKLIIKRLKKVGDFQTKKIAIQLS